MQTKNVTLAIRELYVWLTGSTAANSPSISAGASAPASTRPAGSLFLRTAGIAYLFAIAGWWPILAAVQVADPGNAGALSVAYPYAVINITTAGAETRTVAAPTFANQRLVVAFDVRVGNVVITSATTLNSTLNNTVTLDAAGKWVEFQAVRLAGALVWRATTAGGAALTTV